MARILIVEDDELLLSTLKFDLVSEGFQVIPALSFKEGLDTVRNNKFDLAILDINLPDGDGFNICKEIKTHSNIPRLYKYNLIINLIDPQHTSKKILAILL